jgi:RNA polymerase sigma-70 factor (ECF subfamily)
MGEYLHSRDLIVRTIEKHADTVRRICFMHLKNNADVDDIFQEVFLSLLKHPQNFESEEHEKAWLIRVAINKCKDLHKSFFKSRVCSLDDIEIPFEDETENEVMREILALPAKYKDCIYLFYYEGYSAPEISKLLGVNVNTVYTHLLRAKALLRKKLERYNVYDL